MKRRYIGVFDSGIGGLTTVSQIREKLPNENIVFFGDTENMPYGEKSREQIISLTLNDIDVIRNYDLKAIIIACNTCDCNASTAARAYCDIPVFGVIAPAVRKAVSLTENKKIGIMATEATVATKEYEKRILCLDPEISVIQIASSKLAPLVEEGKFLKDDKEMDAAIEEYLRPLLDQDIDTLILGCTHYDLLADLISKKAPSLKIVSSSRCVIDDLNSFLEENDLFDTDHDPEYIYMVNKDPEHFQKVASCLIDDIEIKKSN